MRGLWLQIPRKFADNSCRCFSSLRFVQPPKPCSILPRSSCFHSSGVFGSRKRNDYFSSKAPAPPQSDLNSDNPSRLPKKKTPRSSAATNSLRRVAVEAQRSRDGKDSKISAAQAQQSSFKVPSYKPLFNIRTS